MASSHKPAWPAGWPGYRDQFRLTGFIWKISARFPRREKTKHPGEESWLEIRETKPNMAKQKIITFVPFIALATVIAVLLQLNGMFIIWKIQQAKQDNAIRASRIHPAFILVTGLKCSYGKISSPLTDIRVGKTEISVTELAHPLIWTRGK